VYPCAPEGGELVKESHLSVETLARWMAGDLPHEDLVRDVFSHFLALCPVCREKFEEIQRLQRDLEHWDERVVVFESQQAPELFDRLRQVPFDQQLGLVRDDEGFQTWGLCQLLLKESLEAAFEEPGQAVNLAELAVQISKSLDDAYDPHCVLDLRAKACAYLGNARRVLGELRSAETAFREAEGFLAASMTGNPLAEAEVLYLKASLRREQRRFPEALRLLDQAVDLYQVAEDAHRQGRTLIKKAKVLEESGDLDGAIDLLPKALELLDTAREPRLLLYGKHNFIGCLTAAGRHQEAQQLLPEMRRLSEQCAKPLDLLRLQWIEAGIALGLGQLDQAEAQYRELQQQFFERRMGYDAALVSLDLAVLYAQQGRNAELKHLAVEIMPVFESRDVHREALAALLMFQHAVEEERLTVNLAHHLAALLKRERPARA
jgi:tetratricopeptide (TPR) repeat protein